MKFLADQPEIASVLEGQLRELLLNNQWNDSNHPLNTDGVQTLQTCKYRLRLEVLRLFYESNSGSYPYYGRYGFRGRWYRLERSFTCTLMTFSMFTGFLRELPVCSAH